jgi:hypothetical protein
MTRRRTSLVALALCAAHVVTAQTAAPTQTPRTIVGVVSDTAGNPIDSAEVTIASLRRRTTAGADGAFRFDKIDPGTYQVSARRFGFAPQMRRVVVAANGGALRFELVPVPHTLAPVISSVARGGLSGVIGDTAFDIVQGATISVLGSTHRTISDSLGKFYLDLHAGRYLVRITHDGFVARMMGVTIPSDSGRRIAVWMVPGSSAEAAKDSWSLDDLNDRLTHRTSRSKIYTREDINNMPMTELTQIALVGGGIRLQDDCPAIIDGGPSWVPLWSVSAADIETVEIYPPKSLLLGAAAAHHFKQPTNCPVQVFVWLRK